MLMLNKVMCNLNNKAIMALLKLNDAPKGVRGTPSEAAAMVLPMMQSNHTVDI